MIEQTAFDFGLQNRFSQIVSFDFKELQKNLYKTMNNLSLNKIEILQFVKRF